MMGNNGKECRFCKHLNPDVSKFCNSCGKSLSSEKSTKEDVITTVNKYADFLRKLNEDQKKVFRWTLLVLGTLGALFLGVLGVGSYQKIGTLLEDAIIQNVEDMKKDVEKLAKEEINFQVSDDRIREIINEALKTKYGASFETQMEEIREQKGELKEQKGELFHDTSYIRIQIARAIAELLKSSSKEPSKEEKNVVTKLFDRAKKRLKMATEEQDVKKVPISVKSYFELGRLLHYYPLIYQDYYRKPKNDREKIEQWKEALDYYEKAISGYTAKQKEEAYHVEPTFYVAQLSINLFLRNEFSENAAKENLRKLFEALNKYRKLVDKLEKENLTELIAEIEDIKRIADKEWQVAWNHNDIETLKTFSERNEYLIIF